MFLAATHLFDDLNGTHPGKDLNGTHLVKDMNGSQPVKEVVQEDGQSSARLTLGISKQVWVIVGIDLSCITDKCRRVRMVLTVGGRGAKKAHQISGGCRRR